MEHEMHEQGRIRGTDYVDPPPAPLIDPHEFRKWSFYRALIAEFMGTAVFLYITVMTVIGNKALSDPLRHSDPCDGVGLLGIAWAFGGTIFIVVYCTAGVSGGHINPAVTFALSLARKMTVVRAVLYWVAQILGALTGVAIAKCILNSAFKHYGGAANEVNYGYSKGVALGAEIMGTFLLVFVVLSATDPKRNARDSHVPVLAPLPIGFAVFMVHLATIPITGTGINPARSLATAIVHGDSWHAHWIFWVGPLLGAALASFFYQVILRGGAIKALGSFRHPSHH